VQAEEKAINAEIAELTWRQVTSVQFGKDNGICKARLGDVPT
jgi:hypothetical protein